MPKTVGWECQRSPPALQDNEIPLWRRHLVVDASTRDRLSSYLRADEKSRAERFYFGLERDRYAIARRAARNIVGVPRCPA